MPSFQLTVAVRDETAWLLNYNDFSCAPGPNLFSQNISLRRQH
jgi:hypothetical protein